MTEIREKLDKQKLFETVAELLKPVIVKTLETSTRTCITCDHFIIQNETCGLNYKRPPAKVIAFGCECYINEVPF